MGLLKCPDCGKEFSDRIDACPNCSCPKSVIPEKEELKKDRQLNDIQEADHGSSNKVNKKRTPFYLLLIFLLLVGMTSFIVIFLYKSKPEQPTIPFSDNLDEIETATLSVVKIYCYNYWGEESATGSGFIGFNNQTVVTNYHVMEEAYTCKIVTEENVEYDVEKILNYSKEKDIAILKLKQPTDLAVLKIGDSSVVKKGEKITAIGSPLGFKNSISQGIVSGKIVENDIEVLQFTASISHGSSGGALFNDSGEVIGITYASYENGQNLNLALPIELAESLYDSKTVEYEVYVIFEEKYQYTKLLREYSNVASVSVKQLRGAPQEYSGKIIKVKGYLSSFLEDYAFYITDRDIYVTGEYFNDCYEKPRKNFVRLRVKGKGNYMYRYSDEDVEVGDKVTILGMFYYRAESATEGKSWMDAIILYKE